MAATEAFERRASYRSLPKGQSIKDFFCVVDSEMRKTNSGEPYVVVKLADCVGLIEGRIWDCQPGEQVTLEPASIIQVDAEIDRFKEQPQLKIHTFRSKDVTSNEEAELYRCSPRDPKDIEKELKANLRAYTNPETGQQTGIHNVFLKKLLYKYFENKEWWRRFSTWPASKKYHHGYKHGLMEHTTNMLQLGNAVCNLPAYRHLDRDVVLTGIMLHDSGKIDEYSYNGGSVAFSDFGELIPHIVTGFHTFMRISELIPDFPDELRSHVGHIILSHHKKPEWGSPVPPKTDEAILVHQIDAMDSELQTGREAADNHNGNGAFSYNERYRYRYVSNPEKLEVEGAMDYLMGL